MSTQHITVDDLSQLTFEVVVQIEKHHLQQIVLDSSTEILGDIWFGSLPGLPPFVSLRLSTSFGEITKPSGRQVFVSSPAPHAIFDGLYSVKLEFFKQLIQRHGFGVVCWSETDGEALVSIEVLDEQLIGAFFQVCDKTIGNLRYCNTTS